MKIITANSLLTGAPLYWAGAGRWSADPAEALAIAPADANTALAEAAALSGIAVNAYLVAIEQHGAPVKREALRETIRAHGPTVRAGPVAAPVGGVPDSRSVTPASSS